MDDEQNAIDGLQAMLKKKFSDQVVITGSSTSAEKAIRELDEIEIDILFLDVEMPKMNGLEVLNQFPNRKFQVIFTTAHDHYAISAIKSDAVDYLLKPLAPSEVANAIQRCLQRKSSSADKSSGKITLSVTGELIIIEIKDIIRVEAENNYSTFYFTNRPRIIVSKTLKEFDEHLSPFQFFRVHQSHLINMNFAIGIKSDEGDKVLLSNGDKVDLSRRRKQEFMEELKKMIGH
ncbi:MAG TPA: LytTR family DNA-binding domain-containing protein [Saprospiraceae bacterium]|nr:LytTR family DNA-binding domain-containing protein [Saprospiraceae bacterium]